MHCTGYTGYVQCNYSELPVRSNIDNYLSGNTVQCTVTADCRFIVFTVVCGTCCKHSNYIFMKAKERSV